MLIRRGNINCGLWWKFWFQIATFGGKLHWNSYVILRTCVYKINLKHQVARVHNFITQWTLIAVDYSFMEQANWRHKVIKFITQDFSSRLLTQVEIKAHHKKLQQPNESNEWRRTMGDKRDIKSLIKN